MDIGEISLIVNVVILAVNTVAAIAAVIAVWPKAKGRHRRE